MLECYIFVNGEKRMTKQEFRDFVINKGIVLLDGATGSNLMSRGMPGGVCPEEWITEHPDAVSYTHLDVYKRQT